jgi:hypothetical protein
MLRISALALAGAMLAACGGGGDASTPSDVAQSPQAASYSWLGTWSGTLHYQGSFGNTCGPGGPGGDVPLTFTVTGTPPQFEFNVTTAPPIGGPTQFGFSNLTATEFSIGSAPGGLVGDSISWTAKLMGDGTMTATYAVSHDYFGGSYCDVSWTGTLVLQE